MDDQQKIDDLLEKLEKLLKRQDQFQFEINQLRSEIYSLQGSLGKENIKKRLQVDPLLMEEESTEFSAPPIASDPPKRSTPAPRPKARKPREPKRGMFSNLTDLFSGLDFEKFIGENLINKIGILITFIGVVIGARYAIENEMISPLTRIILGYLVGFGLLGFALRLKKDYEGFSAVLLSGAMAILYFITFSAYSFYELIPQLLAFGLMLLFTIFTVVAALNYNRQVIAIIGLVGAYGIPFLVSNNSGNMLSFFSYITIINIGILGIAFRKYWKLLYYLAFGFTWLIFASWFFLDSGSDDFKTGMTFAFVFFLLFYLTFLAYKIIKEEELEKREIVFLLMNSFLFFGFGYLLLQDHETLQAYLGLFTLLNALIHFIASLVIFQKGMANRNVFYLISGMVLVFLTIAIPVQLDGNWVTLLWIGEAALLFWIGRSRGVGVYEKISIALMALALFSLFQDWQYNYTNYFYTSDETFLTPFFNIQLLSSLLFIVGLAGIVYIRNKFPSKENQGLTTKLLALIPYALLLVTFVTFFLEIQEYWRQAHWLSAIEIPYENASEGSYTKRDYNFLSFQSIWLCNYTMLFFTALIFAYLKWFRSMKMDLLVSGLAMLSLVMFLLVGLYEISELRESFINRASEEYFYRGSYHIFIRYISLAFCALLLWALSKILKPSYPKIFELLLAGTIIWIASSELIGIRSMLTENTNYKLSLSILWGVYSLLVIGYGIWKKKKHLRVAAIVLFGLTLVKLFLYDLEHLDTISKTIVLVSLGILLLIISFLYNKYQIGEDETA